MATKSLVPVEEYLQLSFDGPDREYLDGEIVERSVGDRSHSSVQIRLIQLLEKYEMQAALFAQSEIRMRVSRSRYRVADLAVFEGGETEEEVPASPPLITIEIVSRDDRHTEIIEKLDEYFRWGVRHVWLIDPRLRKLYAYGASGLGEVEALEVPEHQLKIRMSDLTRRRAPAQR